MTEYEDVRGGRERDCSLWLFRYESANRHDGGGVENSAALFAGSIQISIQISCSLKD